MEPLRRVTAALLLAVLAMGGVVALIYLDDHQEIDSESSTILQQSGSLQGQGSTIQSQSLALQGEQKTLAALEANITATGKALSRDQARVALLKGNITADRSKISAISSAYSQANTTIASLRGDAGRMQAQVASLEGNVTKLQGEAAALDTQISGLESLVSTLQSQLAALVSITSLVETATLLSPQTVGVQPVSSQVAVSFVANFSGYVTVSISAISDISSVQVGVLIFFFGASVSSGQYSSELVGPHSFMSVPDSLVFPVTPGTISVYLANSSGLSQNATLTATYYY
ncbi:MAG: hypothetical protein OK474_06510 [Thaumarchaeota archaeon]|nr:hypothetical protein [Nitrososphaerota archaeon]